MSKAPLKMDDTGGARVGKGMQTMKALTCSCGETIVCRKGLTGYVKCTGCGSKTKGKAS